MENLNQTNSKSKLPKCKAFEIPLKNFAALGIRPALAMQAYPLNGRILMGFLILGCAIFCTFAFVFYDAKTFAENVQSMYMGSFTILTIFCLLTMIRHVERFFEYISKCNELINTSKSENIQLSTQYHEGCFVTFESLHIFSI